MIKNQVDYNVVINLSGGFDSTYLLYKYLIENKEIILHHCNLINHEGRNVVEKTAVKKIIQWFKDNNMDTFLYYETTFDYGNLPYIIKDIEVLALFTGIILRCPQFSNIKEIAISANAHDESNNPNDFSVINRKKIIETIKFPHIEPELTFPIIHMTKSEIIKSMPKDLVKLVWFCRKPQYFDSQDNRVSLQETENAVYAKCCTICATCVYSIETLKQLDLYYDKYYL